jgi:hypothetical protein
MRKLALLLVIVTAVAAVVVITVFMLREAAPRAVRLLPSANAFVYLDLKPLRTAGVLKQMPAVSLEPEYEQFVRETGFQFERDLDEAAFAVHLPAAVNPQQPQATRYSEVFTARFDAGKLAAYLRKIGAAVERYRGLDVYAIALPGRTLRVAIVGPQMVAASNTEGPYVIQSMIDRHQELTPARGPELVRRYYRDVPLGSVAWAITQTTASGPQGNSMVTLPGGYALFFPAGTALVAGLRYVGSVQFKAEAFTETEDQARRVGDQLSAFVALVRTVEGAQTGGEPEVKAFFDSLRVEQRDRRTELTATIPTGLLKKMVLEPPRVPGATAPPAVEKKKPNTETPRHKGRR